MHKKGYQGPLTRDAFWNVEMDRKAETVRLSTPTPLVFMFAISLADFQLAKYWKQKQLFEESQASLEDRQPICIGMCPMICGEFEAPQHFLQCQVLHDAKVMQRDFHGIRKWLHTKQTCPEMSIIIEKRLVHWMKTGTHLEIWELQDTKYKEDLETAIQVRNYIGLQNMLKGRIAVEWGDIQMQQYKDVYEDDMPKHISATWWASEFI